MFLSAANKSKRLYDFLAKKYQTLLLFALLPGYSNPTGEHAFYNPLNGQAKSLSLYEVVGLLVRGILGITGVLAAVFIIWGGIQIVFAAGNEEKVGKGKETLLWAVIGLVVASGGYVIVGYILSLSNQFLSA